MMTQSSIKPVVTPKDWEILARFGVTPDNLTVGRSLDLSFSAIKSLPENLRVGGSLYLSFSAIKSLPENLRVGGSLYLSFSAIKSLPENLRVGGSLYLWGTAIPRLHDDARGYRLDRAGNRYHAGCRRFTASEAIAHWGAPDYPDKDRGAAYVAAVEKEEQRRREIAELKYALRLTLHRREERKAQKAQKAKTAQKSGGPKRRDMYRDQVRDMVANGYTNTEMAAALGISRGTIRTIREELE